MSAAKPARRTSRAAYRKLARQHHPDHHPDDPTAEDKFKEASEAYSVLSDPQKRAAYDRFGHAGVQGAAGRAASTRRPSPISATSSAISSAEFGDLFGGGGGGRRRNRAAARRRRPLRSGNRLRGRGLRHERGDPGAAHGAVRALQRRRAPSPAPDRAPARPATAAARFSTSRASFPSGAPAAPAAAPARSSAIPAAECRGHGYRQVQRKLKVNIPAGVDDGTRLRLASEGQPGAQRRSERRPVRLPQGEAARVLRAPRERPALHHSAEHRAGGAGRRNRSAHPRDAAQAEDPRGHAERRAVQNPPPRRRHPERRRPRRPLHVHVDVKVPRGSPASSANCSSSCATPCRWTIHPPKRACSRRSKTTSCRRAGGLHPPLIQHSSWVVENGRRGVQRAG